MELVWNVFPARAATSALLFVLHGALLALLWRAEHIAAYLPTEGEGPVLSHEDIGRAKAL